MYCHTQKQSSHISLESFSSNSVVLGGEGGVRDEAQIFLKRTLSLSDDIFLCFLPPTTPTQRRDIYNNALFPRVITLTLTILLLTANNLKRRESYSREREKAPRERETQSEKERLEIRFPNLLLLLLI